MGLETKSQRLLSGKGNELIGDIPCYAIPQALCAWYSPRLIASNPVLPPMLPKPLEGKHPLVMNNGGKQYWKLLKVARGEGTLACRVAMLGAGKREMERGSWQDCTGLCFCMRPKKV